MKTAVTAAQEWLAALDLPLSKLTAAAHTARPADGYCTEAFSLFCPVDTLWATTFIAILAFTMAWAIHSFWKWSQGSSASSRRHLTRSKELSRRTAASAAATVTSNVGSEADGQSAGHKKRRLLIIRNELCSIKVMYALPAVILVAAFAFAKIRSPKRTATAAALAAVKKQ